MPSKKKDVDRGTSGTSPLVNSPSGQYLGPFPAPTPLPDIVPSECWDLAVEVSQSQDRSLPQGSSNFFQAEHKDLLDPKVGTVNYLSSQLERVFPDGYALKVLKLADVQADNRSDLVFFCHKLISLLRSKSDHSTRVKAAADASS